MKPETVICRFRGLFCATLLLLVILTSNIGFAQTESLVLSSGTAAANGTIALNLTLSSPTGSEPASLQWVFTYTSSSISSIAVSVSGTAATAGKNVSCVPTSGKLSCVAYGMNSTPIANGIVATVNVTLASGVTSASIGISNAVAASATGSTIAVTGTAGSITGTVTSSPTLTGVSCNPTSLASGASSTCTVSLSAATTSAVTVQLSDNNALLATPASVNVASGSASGSFTVTAGSVLSSQSVIITATLSASSKTTTISLVPLAVESVAVSPSSVVGGNNVSVTVTLSGPAPSGGASVTLSGSSSAFPATSVVMAGSSTSQTFSLPTTAVTAATAVTITASYNGSTAISPTFTVNSPSSTPFTPIFVNAGGGAYTDPQGQRWTADTSYSGGSVYAVTTAISNTTTSPLYQTVRYAGSFAYQFSVPNGSYSVTLKFAEPYFTSSGKRVFNVAINGTQALSNFDVVAQAGGAFKALDKTFPINVTAGSIAITFTGVVENAMVNAIQIVQGTSTSPSFFINSGGAAYTDPQGQAWVADSSYTGGMTYTTATTIQKTTTPALYQTTRYGSSFQYQVNVPSGSYTLTLKFADPYFTTVGSRLFNVSINGAQVLSNFDIVAQAGGGFTAIDRAFPVTVTGGTITVLFTAVVNNATISAIQIVPGSPVTPPPPPSSTFATIQVNAGGPAYTDSQGQSWSADTSFAGGSTYATTAPILNTATPPLYRTVRYGSSFQYQFAVPSGSYTVTLKFAEPYFSSAGKRVFNVAINGTQVLSGFDVVARVGAAFTAYDQSFPVTVTNGLITIQFTGQVENAMVSAIRITNP
jgi:hypothetical protein